MDSWEYACDSLKGIERDENKDRVWQVATDTYLLAVLFDGVSSAAEANKGIDIAVDFLNRNHQKLAENTTYKLSDLMFEAHSLILHSGLKSPFATYSAMYLPNNQNTGSFSNLGDSRIYEVAPQYLKQLTQDDNLMHNKNVVTKYLGMLDLRREEVVDFSINTEQKRFLLCSDGFYSMLEERLSRFYEILNFRNQVNIKKSLSSEIEGNNFDDASYFLAFK